MENGPGLKMYLLLKNGGFPAIYVSLPEGTLSVGGTVDGQNPAPPIMMIIPLFIGF